MATEVEIDAKINTAGSAQSLRALNKDLKDLISLQGQVTSGSDQYKRLQRAITDTEGKIGDLKDSFQTLRGSGIERVNSSLSLFKEGIQNADTDKLKIGLDGIGSAMKAIPIFLLIQGITFLAEKFGILGKVAEFVTGLINDFTDALGFTTIALEKQTKALIESTEKQAKLVQARYEAEIQFANAAGQRTAELEIQKALSVEASAKAQFLYITNLQNQKKELSKEEQKQFEDLQAALIKATSDRLAKQAALSKQFLDIAKNAESDLTKTRLEGTALEIYTIQQATNQRLKELDILASRVVDSNDEYKKFEAARVAITQESSIKIQRIIDAENEKLKALWAERAAEFNRLLGLGLEYQEQVNAARLEDEREANQKIINQYEYEKAFRVYLKQQEVDQIQEIEDNAEAKRRLKSNNRLAFEQAFSNKSLTQQINSVRSERDALLQNEELTQQQRILIIQEAENKILSIRIKQFQKYVGYAQQANQALSEIAQIRTNEENYQLNQQQYAKDAALENDNNRTQEALAREEKQTNQLLANDNLTAEERERIQYNSESRKVAIQNNSQAAQNALTRDFAVKENQLKKQQFERDKKLRLATAFISTAGAVANGLLTQPFIPAGIAAGAAAAALGGIQIAAIARAKYDDGGFSARSTISPATSIDTRAGGGSTSPANFSPSPVSPRQFDPTSVQNAQGNKNTRVYVLQSDIANVTNKVNVIESRSNFN